MGKALSGELSCRGTGLVTSDREKLDAPIKIGHDLYLKLLLCGVYWLSSISQVYKG